MCAQLLDQFGNSIYPSIPTGAFFQTINVRHTAADASGSFIWAFRNPIGSAKTIRILNIRGAMWFDGTAGAGLNQLYEFCKFTGGDPTTGTTIPRAKKGGWSAASVLADANIQQKSGVLTITGITGIEVFHTIRMGASVTNGLRPLDLDFRAAGFLREHMEFAAGDGFGIRLGAAAIIGLGIAGSVETEEMAP